MNNSVVSVSTKGSPCIFASDAATIMVMKRSELKAFLTKSFDHYKRMPIKTTGYQKISDHVKEILTINLSDGDFQENRQQVEEQINDLQSKVDRIDIVTVALTTVSSSLGEYTIYVILGD